MTSKTRVLFVCSEPVGGRMAGNAIRSLELARAVAEHCDVTLAAPAPSDVGDAPIALLEAGLADFDRLLDAARTHHVLVCERLPAQLLRYVMKLPIRYVADLYNPYFVEVLEAVRDEPRRAARLTHAHAVAETVANCAAADFMMCASEKQRDLWLGLLASHALIDLDAYAGDRALRSVLDVVPFGLPESSPPPGRPMLKGVAPGVAAEDRVLVWGGGIWNWLDAITVIKAVERLGDLTPAVHLHFPGIVRPSHDGGHKEMAATREAVEFARSRGLEGRRVHLSRDWVPYERRQDYLLEADLGVSAHVDHLEARFSSRTRVLDYLWSGLPVVATRGDALADLVESHGLGRTVAAGDDAGFAAACRDLLESDRLRESARREIRGISPSLKWSAAVEPLVRYCTNWERLPVRRKRKAVVARATLGHYPVMLGREYDARGAAGLTRKLGRNVWRVLAKRA